MSASAPILAFDNHVSWWCDLIVDSCLLVAPFVTLLLYFHLRSLLCLFTIIAFWATYFLFIHNTKLFSFDRRLSFPLRPSDGGHSNACSAQCSSTPHQTAKRQTCQCISQSSGCAARTKSRHCCAKKRIVKPWLNFQLRTEHKFRNWSVKLPFQFKC